MSEPTGRRGLGRGLSALLDEPEASHDAPPGGPSVRGVLSQEIPIELLRRNPDQPRKRFSQTELEELAASIRERGVLQPLLARPAPGAPGEFQIIAGERRWRAAQLAGLRSLPAVIREDLNELDLLEIGVIENIQREDLRPLEEAEAYRTLIDRFGRTQEEVAKTVGKSRSHVANALRLLALPPFARAALEDGRLTPGHARAVAAAADPDRLARLVVEKDLTVRQAEALAREAAAPAPKAPPPRVGAKNADTLALEQDLSDALGLAVEISDKDGRGELRILYNTLEELDGLCRRLSG
jgi:ParB family chromosome partitioning protein